MLSIPSGNARTQPESSIDYDERPETLGVGRVVRIGRLRVPVTLTAAPWATLYRFPDGRLLWCLRLWNGDRAVTRCATTERLLRYAHQSGLADLARELRELCERARDRRPR